MTNKELQDKILQLERKIAELEKWKAEEIVKDKIVVVAPVDASYNIPILANGQRRKIATSAA